MENHKLTHKTMQVINNWFVNKLKLYWKLYLIGETPLFMAAKFGHFECVRILIEKY